MLDKFLVLVMLLCSLVISNGIYCSTQEVWEARHFTFDSANKQYLDEVHLAILQKQDPDLIKFPKYIKEEQIDIWGLLWSMGML
jgi:hypothetical protein